MRRMFAGAAAAGGALVGCVSAAGLYLLHPRLGIRDVDGYAYLMGARSLQQGAGYRSLTGEPFNHWPPGYSLLLSLFPDPLVGALVVNYLSFGAVVGLLYYLLRRSGWSWQAGLGLTVVLASGFFRLLANIVHAELITYALFLVAMCLAVRGSGRFWPGVIWALLVPVKFIALVFLPPSMVADRLAGGQTLSALARSYLPAAGVLGVCLGGILVFNALTAQEVVAASHADSSLRMLWRGAVMFAASIPRTFLFDWHGSVFEVLPQAAFVVSMFMAALCFLSLRPVPGPSGRWLRTYGVALLACVAVLLCVRAFDPTARLTGYGLIALCLGFRPMPVKWANGAWLLYGIVALMTAVTNGAMTPSLGLNDSRYVDLAREFRAYHADSGVVATNAFRILDLHANIPSVRITTVTEAEPYRKLFWVTLPNVDLTDAVSPMPRPGQGWCEERQFSGGVLFARCDGAGARREVD